MKKKRSGKTGWISEDTKVFLVFLGILCAVATSLVMIYFAIFIIKWHN